MCALTQGAHTKACTRGSSCYGTALSVPIMQKQLRGMVHKACAYYQLKSHSAANRQACTALQSLSMWSFVIRSSQHWPSAWCYNHPSRQQLSLQLSACPQVLHSVSAAHRGARRHGSRHDNCALPNA